MISLVDASNYASTIGYSAVIIFIARLTRFFWSQKKATSSVLFAIAATGIFGSCGLHHLAHAIHAPWSYSATALCGLISLPAGVFLLSEYRYVARALLLLFDAQDEVIRLRAWVEAAPVGFWVLRYEPEHDDFRFLAANQMAEDIVGIGSLDGLLMCESIPGHRRGVPGEGGGSTLDLYKDVAFATGRYPSGRREALLEFESEIFGGRAWFQQVVQRFGNGRIAIAALNVTEQIRTQRQLEEQAMTDPLTGACSRRFAIDLLNQAAAAYESRGVVSSVLLLDLDKFKPINDTYGHDVGDKVLREVVGRIQGALRPADRVCRLGGDEFLVVLTGEPIEKAYSVARRVWDAVAQPMVLPGGVVDLGVSIGVADFSEIRSQS